MNDNVHSPNHYTQGYFETIYEIADVLGAEGFRAFCMGNYIKYNARANHKGLRADDLAKAEQYLEWAANGLPAPENGRLPKRQDIYKTLFDAMQAKDGESPTNDAERTVSAPAELAAPYGATKTRENTTSPTARTVANAIGPAFVKALGYSPLGEYGLRVTLESCATHGTKWYTVRVFERETNEVRIEMAIANEDPDENVLDNAGSALAYLFREYIA